MLRALQILGLIILLAGCKGGGGGGGSSAGVQTNSADNTNVSAMFYVESTGGTGSNSTDTTVRTYHNPEPTSLVLLGIGLAGLAAARRKKNKK